jgi:predicted ATPase
MIQQITIRNFKSLGDVTVDLEPTTVFIGRSGVGKSNFLRAIRFLRNYLIRGERAVAEEGGWHRIYPFGSPKPLSIGIKFRLPGFEDSMEYLLAWEPTGQNSTSSLRIESLIFGSEKVIYQSPAPSHFGQQPLAAKLGIMPTRTEAVLAFAALTGGIGWHDFPASVFTDSHKQVSEAKGLDDAATNYLIVMKNLTEDLRDQRPRRQIISRLKQINPSVASVELDSLLNPQRAVVGHRVASATIPLDLSQESDGFRRYLAHLLAIYQTPPKQLLMFEEPENGIAPGALKNLAEEFSDSPQHMRGQVLISTQSPELLDGFDPQQIRVVDLDQATQFTKIGRLDSEQIEAVRDQLLTPGELLTVDQARLMPEKASAS